MRFVTGGLRKIEYDPKQPSYAQLDIIYSDESFATHISEGRIMSSTSQPSLMARMLEILELGAGQNVLEIGTGIGYNAALMSEITGQKEITTIDVITELVHKTRKLLKQISKPVR